MSASTVLLYITTWLVIALTPGPAVLCIIAQVAKYGFGVSRWGILGVQLGNLTFFMGLGTGLVALLTTATNALSILQFAGAGYLLYLGIRFIRSSFRQSGRNLVPPSTLADSGNVVLQAFAIQVTNPNAVLLICTIAVDTAVLVSYAFFTARGLQSFRSCKSSRWIETALGAALASLGLKLLFWQR
jgi:threonine/homoserine/homoserine lactone efflux protein